MMLRIQKINHLRLTSGRARYFFSALYANFMQLEIRTSKLAIAYKEIFFFWVIMYDF